MMGKRKMLGGRTNGWRITRTRTMGRKTMLERRKTGRRRKETTMGISKARIPQYSARWGLT